jgi:hypothetical protein
MLTYKGVFCEENLFKGMEDYMNQRFIARIVTCFGVLALMMLLSLSDAFAAPKSAAVAPQAASGIVNLNTATQAELEKLPGIGPAMAKKIVAGRPYASVSDLSQKAGLPDGTLKKISPLVTVGATAKSSAIPAVKTSVQNPVVKSPAVPKTVAPNKVVPPAGKGMVWANPDSKVYHKEGSYWYGKTKTGSYMTEAEAVKAGYRAPKQGSRNQ